MFKSADQMIDAHVAMFGSVGQLCAEFVLKWAPVLFEEPLDPLAYRVILAPVELGPYNRHAGYNAGSSFILANRHICELGPNGEVVLKVSQQRLEDFLVHELTHSRQHTLLDRAPCGSYRRGAHRDHGWYGAVSEACPRYLGVELPRSSWPAYKSVRNGKRVSKVLCTDVLTEPILTHWPDSFRSLIDTGDTRLSQK